MQTRSHYPRPQQASIRLRQRGNLRVLTFSQTLMPLAHNLSQGLSFAGTV